MHQINKKKYLFHFISIIVISALSLVNIRNLDYITVLNDEFGYWGVAASIAGYDWRNLLSVTPYYSIGYSLWLVPIIKLLPTAELWYKAAILLNIIFLIGSYFLCCNIGKKLFSNINYYIICFASLLTIIYPANRCYAEVAWSETLLYFLVWCLTYCIIELDECFSFKWLFYTLFLLVYSYCVHIRNVGIIFAAFLVLILIFTKHKKPLKYVIMTIICLIFGYLLVNQLKDYVLDFLWNNSDTSALNNIAINSKTLTAYMARLFYGLRLFAESLGAKIIYLCLGTGLTIGIVIFKFCSDTINNIKKHNLFANWYISKIWCVLIVVVMCGLTALQMLDWTSRKDIIVYSRYMEHALGPILFLGMIYLLTQPKMSRWGITLSAFLIFLGLRSVYLRINGAEGSFNSICSPIIGAFYDNLENTEKVAIWIGLITCILMVVLFISTLIKRRNSIIISGSMLFGFFLIIGLSSSTFLNTARKYFTANTVPIRDIILEYNDRNIVYIKNKEISEYCASPKYLQFMIPEDTIETVEINELSKLDSNEVLILVEPRDTEGNEKIEKMEKCTELISTSMLKLYLLKQN